MSSRGNTFEPPYYDGATWLLDTEEDSPAIWGEGRQILWAKGEALVIAGGDGVGKTTLACLLLAGRLGIVEDVLGLPVEPADGPVLYLAMDRPRQIRRAFGRLLKDEHRRIIRRGLVFRQGPPEEDIAHRPELLLEMCQDAGASTLFVDSLKDATVGISGDDTASRYNRARQICVSEGIEIVELHHTIKSETSKTEPTTLADVYGSRWITAGAGSVISLHSKAGADSVVFRHLKQPLEVVGPWTLKHDHTSGLVSVAGGLAVAEGEAMRDEMPELIALADQIFEAATENDGEVTKQDLCLALLGEVPTKKQAEAISLKAKRAADLDKRLAYKYNPGNKLAFYLTGETEGEAGEIETPEYISSDQKVIALRNNLSRATKPGNRNSSSRGH